MSKFPHIIPEDRKGQIPLHTDIGVDILLDELYKNIPNSEIGNERTSHGRVKDAIRAWVLGFETNPRVVAERQEVVRYALDNLDFIEAIDNLAVYPNQISDRQDEFTRYTGMVRRFDTFAESVSAIRKVLIGKKKPNTLSDLLGSCEEAEAKVQDAKSHLNPEFELRVEGQGRYEQGVLLELFSEDRRMGKCGFVYILTNTDNNSIKRGEDKRKFGISSGYYDRGDYFLKSLERTVERALEHALGKKPFFKRAYVVNGTARYSPNANKTEGEFHFAREGGKEEGTFPVSFDRDYDNTPKSIIELARFAHNYQIVSPFEEMIHDFEDTVVELKGLSATTHLLKNLRERGFPLIFPNIVSGDSDDDLYIRNMYHPLLAHFSKNGGVIPNDVETTRNQNVRLVTGANNNGKTCYMDGLGLSQTMYQAGMPIIAEEARMRLKDKILTHYVRPGDIKASQSRFAHECARVLELIEDISTNSLILCDELFTGTAPQDGEIVSKLVLDSLVRTGATLFFTTHYHGLGDQLRDSPYVAQLCCKLDHSTDPPSYTYRIEPGISRDSDGLVVAAQYGINRDHLPALLTQKARAGDFKLR